MRKVLMSPLRVDFVKDLLDDPDKTLVITDSICLPAVGNNRYSWKQRMLLETAYRLWEEVSPGIRPETVIVGRLPVFED